MSGTKEGGLKAGKTTKERYGEDFYQNIGQTGGLKSRGGGFAYYQSEYASLVGQIGGMKSAHKRYGTPIDEHKLKMLERRLKIVKNKI